MNSTANNLPQTIPAPSDFQIPLFPESFIQIIEKDIRALDQMLGDNFSDDHAVYIMKAVACVIVNSRMYHNNSKDNSEVTTEANQQKTARDHAMKVQLDKFHAWNAKYVSVKPMEIPDTLKDYSNMDINVGTPPLVRSNSDDSYVDSEGSFSERVYAEAASFESDLESEFSENDAFDSQVFHSVEPAIFEPVEPAVAVDNENVTAVVATKPKKSMRKSITSVFSSMKKALKKKTSQLRKSLSVNSSLKSKRNSVESRTSNQSESPLVNEHVDTMKQSLRHSKIPEEDHTASNKGRVVSRLMKTVPHSKTEGHLVVNPIPYESFRTSFPNHASVTADGLVPESRTPHTMDNSTTSSNMTSPETSIALYNTKASSSRTEPNLYGANESRIVIDDIKTYKKSTSLFSGIQDYDLSWQKHFHEEHKSKEQLDITLKCIAYDLYEVLKVNHVERKFTGNNVFNESFASLSEVMSMLNEDPATSEEDIYEQLFFLFECGDLNSEHAVLTYIYVKRLIANAEQRLWDLSWRSIVSFATLTAVKTWDDCAVYNADFAQLFPGIEVPKMNLIEKKFLEGLNWEVAVTCSAFAENYFFLRSLQDFSTLL